MDATIRKDELGELFTKLGYDILAPVRKERVVSFKKVDDPTEIAWEFANVTTPPKKLLFPQTEVMYTFDPDTITDKTPKPVPRLIMGIRPCDARSFRILDPVFSGDFQDPYYLNRQKNTLLAGLACNDPGPNCFCTSLGAGPFNTQGLDLLLVDLGDELFIRSVTGLGERFLADNLELFPRVADQAARVKELKVAAEKAISRHVETSTLPEKLKNLFDDPIWDQMSQTCVGCYICTYMCPTCHCFDIQDENLGHRGRRIRVWDSCANPEYTLHASGYNPRPGRKNRMRNRILHKYQYHPENHEGQILCVGCGRCIDLCPVNNDLVEELTLLGGV